MFSIYQILILLLLLLSSSSIIHHYYYHHTHLVLVQIALKVIKKGENSVRYCKRPRLIAQKVDNIAIAIRLIETHFHTKVCNFGVSLVLLLNVVFLSVYQGQK